MVEVRTIKHRYQTLRDAHAGIDQQIKAGFNLVPSLLWKDRISPPSVKTRKGHMLQSLGVEPKAETVCRRYSPDGEWVVEMDPVEVKDKPVHYRCMAWYTRFLPYAVAVMESEEDFKCLGIDFESINGIFKTCGGFLNIGFGQDGAIVKEDVDLFNDVYNASQAVRSPDLPFYEVFDPCVVFVALQKPRLVTKHFAFDHWMREHVRMTCDQMNRPYPPGFKG